MEETVKIETEHRPEGGEPGDASTVLHVEARKPEPVPPKGEGLALFLIILSPFAFFASCLGLTKASDAMSHPYASLTASSWGLILGGIAYVALCVYAIVRRMSTARKTAVAGLVITVLGALSGWAMDAFLSNFPSRGRALRRRGKARVPLPREDTDWCEDVGPLPPSAPAGAGWRLNAATEAASVAAFSHLSQELLVLGAPARLVTEAHTDALDEIRHARVCYGIARAFDGKALGPGAFPEAAWPADRPITLESVAAECVIESCLLEAASAKVAAALAAHPGVPASVARALTGIAGDEENHAKHGHDILAWCLERGGAGVRREIQRALEGFNQAAVQGVGTDDLQSLGLAGSTLWRRCVDEARSELDRRLAQSGG